LPFESVLTDVTMAKLLASLLVVGVNGLREAFQDQNGAYFSTEVDLCEDALHGSLSVDFVGDASLVAWDPFGGYKWQDETKKKAKGSFELTNWSDEPFMAVTWGKVFRKRYSANCKTATVLRMKYVSEPNSVGRGSKQYHDEKKEYLVVKTLGGQLKYREPASDPPPLTFQLSSAEDAFLVCLPKSEVLHVFPKYTFERRPYRDVIPTEAQACVVNGVEGYAVKISGDRAAVTVYTLSIP